MYTVHLVDKDDVRINQGSGLCRVEVAIGLIQYAMFNYGYTSPAEVVKSYSFHGLSVNEYRKLLSDIKDGKLVIENSTLGYK